MLAAYTPKNIAHEAYIIMQTAVKETGLTMFQLARANGFDNCYDWQRKIMHDIEIEKHFAGMVIS